MKEKYIFSDIMAIQNQLALHCGKLAEGCTTPQLRDTVWSVLNEEFLMQGEIQDEMKNRSWICPPPASPEEMEHFKQQIQK